MNAENPPICGIRPKGLWLAALLLIVGVGAGLRFFRLGHSLRVDEVEAWAYSARPLGEILSDPDRLPHLSIIHYLSARFLGESEFLLRLPFALYGILSLPLVFLLGKEIFDAEVGLLACLLLSVSVFHIQFSQESRYYAPFMFYSVSALYCLLMALRRGKDCDSARPAFWAGFAVSHVLNIYLHRFALYPFFLCILLVLWRAGLLWKGGQRLSSRKMFFFVVCLGIFFFMVYAPQFEALKEILSWEAPGIEGAGGLAFFESYLVWHNRLPGSSVLWDFLKAYSGGWQAGLLLLGAGLVGGWSRGKDGLLLSVPLLLWLLLPLGSLFIVKTRTHFELRYFIFILPVWLILTASGVSAAASLAAARLRWGGGARRLLLLGLSAGIVFFDARALCAYYQFPKARIRETFAYLNSSCSPGDAVVMYPAWDVLWYGYYRLKPGCRLFHPAALLADSPAFAPGKILRDHPFVHLAGTWIEDTVRAEEFDKIRGLLDRHCAAEGRQLFPSRYANDNYQVFSYRCGADMRVTHLPAVKPLKATPPSAWKWRSFWLRAHLPQAARRLRGKWPFSEDLRLWRGRSGTLGTGSMDKVLYVWSGSGTLKSTAWDGAFSAGDVYSLPGGKTWRWESPGSSPAVLLILDLGPADNGGEAVPRLLGNAASAVGGPGEDILLRRHDWRVSFHRLAPGSEQRADHLTTPPLPQMFSLLIRGGLSIRVAGKIETLFSLPGDFFSVEKVGMRRPFYFRNPGKTESLELRLVNERRERRPAVSSMTSATGKAGGAWPPMLIR